MTIGPRVVAIAVWMTWIAGSIGFAQTPMERARATFAGDVHARAGLELRGLPQNRRAVPAGELPCCSHRDWTALRELP